jgi:hypothetical protein
VEEFHSEIIKNSIIIIIRWVYLPIWKLSWHTLGLTCSTSNCGILRPSYNLTGFSFFHRKCSSWIVFETNQENIRRIAENLSPLKSTVGVEENL